MKLQNFIPSIIGVNDQGEFVDVYPEVVDTKDPDTKFVRFPDSEKVIGVIKDKNLHYVGEEVMIRRDKFGNIAPCIKHPGRGKIECIRKGGNEIVKGPYDFGVRMSSGEFDYVRPAIIQSIPQDR